MYNVQCTYNIYILYINRTYSNYKPASVNDNNRPFNF